MDEQLKSLQDLGRLILDAELADLRRLADETHRRQLEIARLGAAVAKRSAELGGPRAADDLAFRVGQDGAWLAWLSEERNRLTRAAADAAARREAQRKRAQRALGQVSALEGIVRLDEEERRMRKARRAQADPDGSGRAN